VPHLWSPSDNVLGDGFKFHDYASAFGLSEFPANEWRLTPRAAMAERVEELHQLMLDYTVRAVLGR
jgi:hypothetical protein